MLLVKTSTLLEHYRFRRLRSSFAKSQESFIAFHPVLILVFAIFINRKKLRTGVPLQMVQFQYSTLANQDEIRVIQLLTERDHPRHATGPIHCRIEHVLLNNSQRTTDGRYPAKYFEGTWPNPYVKGIAAQPQIGDGGNSNVFWKMNLTERVFGRIRSSVGPRPPSSSCPTEAEVPTDYDRGVQVERPGLSWRYTWGDFVALSYVWGDPSVKREIFIGKTSVLVTDNLEAALRQLRNHSRIQEGFRIWIDALCINQADADERAVQVSRMKDIYAKAWRVIVWLGPEAKNSNLAMMAIRFLSIRSQEKEPLHGIYHKVEFYIIRMTWFQWKHEHTNLRMRKTILRAIYHLLTRSYWRRLWIIQEVALAARQSPVLCGDSCILLEDLHNALEVIQRDGTAFGHFMIDLAKGSGTFGRRWDHTKRDTYKISEKLWERPIAIIEAQSKQEEPATQKDYSGVFGALLLSLEAFSSDERDGVYGILGLPCLTGVVDIFPDYNRSPTELFIIFSKSLFMSGDLNGLSLIRNVIPPIGTWYFKPTNFSHPRAPKLICHHRTVNRGCRHVLPSWVICCSCPPNPVLPLPRGFSALSIKPYIARPIFRDKFLIVQGVLFDTLSTLSAFHATESDRKYPQNGPRRTSIYGSESATKEAFWRTLVANTDRFSEPAPAEYCQILDPRIWQIGIPGVATNIFGLQDFYQRNKSLVIFNQTVSRLIHGPKITMAQRMKKYFKTTGRLLRATSLHRDATLRAMRVLAWRRLVTTHGGYLGLVPAGAIAGDVVATIMGCDVPLLLRPAKGEETSPFTLIGECYVHGVMSGEVLDFLKQGKCKMDSISIV